MTVQPRLTNVVLDAANIGQLSSFWAELLGGTVDSVDDQWHNVRVPGMPVISIQYARGHVPPQWPDGPPQQVHLDFEVDDIAAAHAHALDVGAAVLSPAEGPDEAKSSGFQVYADPAGHPFCLCWGP
jgi:predicted enzyme related to lactoylglutathione lyase